MDLRKIKKLIELVEESGVTELEVSSGDESIPHCYGDDGCAGHGTGGFGACCRAERRCPCIASANSQSSDGRCVLPSAEPRS